MHPHRVAAVRLLREHSTEAGVDPFLESFNAAERLAMLLDRVDELPLRRHEIRGNAGGLLARLIGRIDALKAAAVTPERFRALGRRADAGGIRRRASATPPSASASSPSSTRSTTPSCSKPAPPTAARPSWS